MYDTDVTPFMDALRDFMEQKRVPLLEAVLDICRNCDDPAVTMWMNAAAVEITEADEKTRLRVVR